MLPTYSLHTSATSGKWWSRKHSPLGARLQDFMAQTPDNTHKVCPTWGSRAWYQQRGKGTSAPCIPCKVAEDYSWGIQTWAMGVRQRQHFRLRYIYYTSTPYRVSYTSRRIPAGLPTTEPVSLRMRWNARNSCCGMQPLQSVDIVVIAQVCKQS